MAGNGRPLIYTKIVRKQEAWPSNKGFCEKTGKKFKPQHIETTLSL